MSVTPGRGAAIGGMVAVLAIGVGLWLMTSDRGGSESTATDKPAETETAPDTPIFATDAPAPDAAPIESGKTPMKPLTTVPNGGEPGAMPVVAQGTVSWAAGQLPPDVDVSLYDAAGDELDSTTADEKGHYELRWDEPLLAGWSVGTDSVRAKVGEKNVDLTPDNVGPLPMHLPKEPPLAVDLVLGLPPLIVGSVTDRVTGAPLAGAIVNVSSVSRAWALDTSSTLTDEQGHYELEIDGLPLRGLMIWATADEHIAQLAGPQDITPAATPDATVRFDFPLEAPAAWRGKVVDANTGVPVPDATITLGSDYAALEDVADFEITDENGEFELDVPDMPAQGAWLHVYTDEDGYGAAFLRNIQPGQDLLVRLGGRPTLSGKVLLGKDKPARMADVTIYFDGEPPDGMNGLCDEDRTDADGAFSIPLQYAPFDSAKVRVDALGCAIWEARLADVARGSGLDLTVEVQLVEMP